MKTSFLRQNVFPVLAAFIWGTAFVAQSVAADHVEAMTFNAARAVVAFVFLLALCIGLRKFGKGGAAYKAHGAAYWRDLLVGGFCCGLALTLAANLQQKGIETTTSGKAGFITALYIVIVPIFGLFLHKKAPRSIWLSVALAVVGLYCLCIKEGFSITLGDFYILLCAFCFSAHILIIDHFTQKVDGVELSCAQFLVVTILSGIGMLAFEHPVWTTIQPAIGAILYVGIFSSGVAYTLQILAQKDSNPTVVSLLMSLEAVFATLGGAIILHDQMSGREYLGCLIMLIAVVLAQLPERKPKQREATLKLKRSERV
jgi:drug/metabolite transporter (DMT)-like permease